MPATPGKTARVAAAWLRAGSALRCALRTRDLSALWSNYGEGEMPRPLSNYTQALLRAGTLQRVDGRWGSTRFVHVDAPPLVEKPEVTPDFNLVVLEAVAHAARRACRFVTTREVTAALPAVGFAGALDKALRTRLWQSLDALATPKKSSTPGAPDAPAKLQKVATQRPHGAKAKRTHVYWWAPAGANFTAPSSDASASPREAVIRLVRAATEALGMPVTGHELVAYARWLHRQSDEYRSTAVVTSKAEIGAALKAARLDNGGHARANRQFGVLTHQTQYTAGRLVPVRFSTTPASDGDVHLMTALDLLAVLRPAHECALMDALIANATSGTNLAADLVTMRRVVLNRELTNIASAADWPTMLIRLRSMVDRLYEWHTGLPMEGPGSANTRRTLKAIEERARDLDAVEQALGWAETVVPARFADLMDPRVVGAGPSLSFEELGPLQDGLAALQRGRAGVHPVFRRARRVAGTRPDGWRAGAGQAPAWERIDRVDAYAVAVDHIGAPQTTVQVGDAVMLLGNVLRDERLLVRALETAGAGDEWIERGLIVALGLLGHAVPTPRWLQRPSLAEAGLLGVVLAAPVSAPSVLGALLREGDGMTRQTMSDALTQVECGEWLALLG
ncbi:hypothetical protein [Gemmatimonas sp.]|uniref:hypothetical protein n=1 Tax=Gemmatimonas sp. TaxID=1962908 RepID=UPI003DA65F77